MRTTREVASLIVFVVCLAATPGWANEDGPVSMLRAAEAVKSQQVSRVFQEYWSEDGFWVTEAITNTGQLCVIKYAATDEVLKEVSRECSDPGPVAVGSRGSGAQRKVFEEWAPAVVLIKTGVSIGSGIVISKDGLILTNRHVVLNAPRVAVFFYEVSDADGDLRLFEGEVIAADKVRDLALIRVASPPRELKVIKINEDAEVHPGDGLIAIGHPLGLQWTPTEGTASVVREDFAWSQMFISSQARIIQFQTPISPGNSGGPLLSEAGYLVGVNSFIKPQGQNINFAIHVSEVADFLKNKNDYPPSNVHDWLKLTARVRNKLGMPAGMLGQQCDFENDGVVDLVRIDSNGNGQWDRMALDVDLDSRFEFMSLDQDEDGYFEILLLDRNLDDTPDYVFYGNPSLRIPVGVEFMSH